MSRPGCGYWNSPDPDVVSTLVQQRYVTPCALAVMVPFRSWLALEQTHSGFPLCAGVGISLNLAVFAQVSQVESGVLAVGYSGTALAVAGGRGEGEAW
jgi:hypothetical protein